MRLGMQEGHVLPKSLIKKVVPQLKALTTKDLDTHLFYQPIKNLLEDFEVSDKERFTKAYTSMVLEKIAPAYEKLYAFMNEEYMQAGRTSSGIQREPNGDAFYAHQIKKYTTTNMTAEEIHVLGLSEVARIRAEMEKN